MSEQEVQAWETEDAVLVVWGTHNVFDAHKAARQFYIETVGEAEIPDGLFEELAEVIITGRGRYWGEPELLDLEEVVWPKNMWSKRHVEGRIPYMVVSW